MNGKKLVIFDLDGTLIDSLKDIALCTNSVLKNLGYKEHSTDAYKKFIGDGARELVRRALPDSSLDDEIEKALEMFKEIYGNKIGGNTKPFEGIYEMLEELQKFCEFALLSNKPHKFTLEYMESFFKDYPFNQVHGQKDDVPRKPDPAGVYNILQELPYEKEDVFYIGDTATDMKTAVSAGLIPIGVLWGIQEKETLLTNGAQYIVESPSQIVKIISNF